ncbi:unnamed protein product [Closterium sp. NIES-65]|nr:unnamed protein product [Closterium sp. NIES-65]
MELCYRCRVYYTQVFTEFVETVNGVHFSRDRNTLIRTIHEAHRITGEVARPVTEHGFSVQHLTNTRIVNIRGSVPEGGLPHLQGTEDALKGHYRVMLMKRAIAAKRFQFDYSASIADVDYGLMLEWLGESWTRVRAATMQRSWWRAGCVPPSWPPLMAYLNDTCATGMFEPLIATCVELQLLIEKFKMRPACYMTAAEFVNCDAGLCVEQGFRATPAASASDDSSGEMSLPDGPLLRDERSRRRVIRNVTMRTWSVPISSAFPRPSCQQRSEHLTRRANGYTKWVHLAWQAIALILAAAGLASIIVAKNYSDSKHMYSVHAYCGVLTLALFVIQFFWGLCAFVLFKSRLSEATRYQMGTYHILLGKLAYYAGIGTCVNGFADMQMMMVDSGQPSYDSSTMAQSWAAVFLWFTSAAVFCVMTTSRTAEVVTDFEEKDAENNVAV